MKNVLKVTHPNDYAAYVHAPALHPLVCILRYEELGPFRRSLNRYGVYGLFIQEEFPRGISYGMKTYETHGPSIIAVAPGQIGGVEDNGELITRKGWVVLWSPELVSGAGWEKKMEEYRFFSYFSDNALQMSPAEWERISGLIGWMRCELQENEDSPELRGVLRGYLHAILEYCNRIYLRQESVGGKGSSDILKRFQRLLSDYYAESRQLELGIPSVQYCAAELAYSPRYLGDIIHRATGGTAIGYIHAFLIGEGKMLLMQGYNVSETAGLLGFEYVHHFNRIFKRITGLTPTEYLRKQK